MTYTFTGTGLEVLGETYQDEGSFNVYVDGKQDTRRSFTENTSGATRLAQQVVYSVNGLGHGSHTVKIVKTGGNFLNVDGFVVIPDAIRTVHDIAFWHIAFEYSTWNLPATAGYIDNQAGVLWDTSGPTPRPAIVPAAVTVSRGAGITFTDDTFAHLGATAVDLADGTQDSAVQDSVITDTAGGGVSVGRGRRLLPGQPGADDDRRHDRRQRDLLRRAGLRRHDRHLGRVHPRPDDHAQRHRAHPVLGHVGRLGLGLRLALLHAGRGRACPTCEHGTDYAGGNVITGNYVHDVMNTLYDGGPIYTNGGQGDNGAGATRSSPGTTSPIGNHDDNMLYQDEGSSYWHTHDNVVNFAAGGNWIGMWTPTDQQHHGRPGQLPARRRCSNNNGTDITYTPPTVVTDGAWPARRPGDHDLGRPAAPAGAADVYDDDSQALSYTGDWTAQGIASADQGDTHRTTQHGAAVTLHFTGQSIAFVTDARGRHGAESRSTASRGRVVRTYAPVRRPGPDGVHRHHAVARRAHHHRHRRERRQLAVGAFQVPAQPYLSEQATPVPRGGQRLTVARDGRRTRPGAAARTSQVTLLGAARLDGGQPATSARVPPGGTATATFTVTPPAPLPPDPALLTAVARYSSGPPSRSCRQHAGQTTYGSLARGLRQRGRLRGLRRQRGRPGRLGYSFSATALANAGVTPGSTVTAGGLSFTWPAPPRAARQRGGVGSGDRR